MTQPPNTPQAPAGGFVRLPAAKSLFSQHYLQARLPDHAEWAADPRPVFETVRGLWERARALGSTWNEAQTEQEFIQPVLETLGWSYIVQAKSRRGGQSATVTRPDYALFTGSAAKEQAYPFQGDDDAFYGRAAAIAEAKYWGRPLSQQDGSGRNTWKAESNPSHQMVSYLVGTRCPWGILTNGQVWRLYSREVSSTASEFYEVDLGLIFDRSLPLASQARGLGGEVGDPTAEQLADFKRWWLFFRRDAFVPDTHNRSFVQRVREGSATYARRVSDKLKELVFDEVMPEVANGFVAYRREQLGIGEETAESLREVYAAGLGLLYKLLFVLYAEARDLLPMRNPAYREQSLTSLAEWAADRKDHSLPVSDATFATPRYEALLALFRRIDRGDASLGVPRYDGGLFNADTAENRFLERHKLSDRAVARVVDLMVRDAGEPVDYAYLSVRNLGTMYEGLLENRLTVVDERRRTKDETTSVFGPSSLVVLVNDKGERKLSGSYYTPDFIVEYNVSQTLDPILDERAPRFAAAMDRSAALRKRLERTLDTATVQRLREALADAERDALEAFLGIKVCDSAMGSGHFLVNAVDHLTDGIIRLMQVYHDTHPDVLWAWNPVQRLIEKVRQEILDEMAGQGIAVDPLRLDDTALLTRLVMKRCIYGVDLNPLAVELAKLSLWLHSFTVGAPLSFLDHHLRWGNSVIGADVRSVEAAMRGEQQTGKLTEASRRLAEGRKEQASAVASEFQFGLFQGPFAGLLDLTAMMIEVAERADATLADVRQSAENYAAFQRELLPYKQALDLWVSQWFGDDEGRKTNDEGRPPLDDGRPPLDDRRPPAERASPVPTPGILSGTKRRVRSEVEGRLAVEFMTMHSEDVLPALRGEMIVAARYEQAIARAHGLWAQQRFFHWDLEFPEVFVDLRRRDWAADGGFDAMIGNPPYVRQEMLAPIKPYLQANYYSFHSVADLYLYFYERGLRLLNGSGRLAYISSGTFARSNFATAFRKWLPTVAHIQSIIDFGENQPFEAAEMVRPSIVVLQNSTESSPFRSLFIADAIPTSLVEALSSDGIDCDPEILRQPEWTFQSVANTQLVAKLLGRKPALSEVVGDRLYRGLITGLNDAFAIDELTYNRVAQPDVAAQRLLKPSVRGEDLRPWYQEDERRWMIVIPAGWTTDRYGEGLNEEQAWHRFSAEYPALAKHLHPFAEAARRRQDKGDYWWELRSCDYYGALDGHKIFWPDVSKLPRFSWDDEGKYINNTGYFVASGDWALLGILQSRVTWFVISQVCQPLRLRAGLWQYRLFPQFLNRLPIPDAPAAEREVIAGLALAITEQARARYAVHRQTRHRILTDLGAPGAALNQKLTAWWELDFPGFLGEVRKAFKREIPVRQRDDWEGWLAAQRGEHAQRTAEIVRLETQLNQRVYTLFDLSSAEIKLIEESTKYRYGEV